LSKVKSIRPDKVSNAVMVHLVRPAEFEASDKVYLQQVIETHPDLVEFIHEHILDPNTDPPTEHVIMEAFVFNYARVHFALLRDCKFEIVEWIDRKGERMNLKEHTAQLMQKVMSNAEVIG